MNPSEVKTKDAVLIQFHNFKVWYDTEKTEDKCLLKLFEVKKAMDEWADIKVTAALSGRSYESEIAESLEIVLRNEERGYKHDARDLRNGWAALSRYKQSLPDPARLIHGKKK